MILRLNREELELLVLDTLLRRGYKPVGAPRYMRERNSRDASIVHCVSDEIPQFMDIDVDITSDAVSAAEELTTL